MKNNDQIIPKPPIKALHINQALIGLELASSDTSVLEYINYFTKDISTNAAYFMHVLPPIDWIGAIMEKESVSFEAYYKLTDEAINHMENQVKATISNPDKLYIEYDVRVGNPLTEILKSAKELEIDLLVIGQSNHKTSHNILAKNLAKKTSANALIIPEGAKKSIENILVPIDFSTNAGRALEAAVSLAKQLDGKPEITCVYIYRIPSLKHFKVDAPWIQTISTVEANIRKAFEDFVFEYVPEYEDKIKFELIEKTVDSIASNIEEYAEAQKIDFLVLGAKGHSRVHRLLLGSVTEELLDINDSIPTMIIK